MGGGHEPVILGVEARKALYREPLWLPDEEAVAIGGGGGKTGDEMTRGCASFTGKPLTEGLTDGPTEILRG